MKQRAWWPWGSERRERGEEEGIGSRRIWRYHGVYGGRERGDSKGAVRRRLGCAQQVEGELSVEGTSAAAVAGGSGG